MTDLRKHDSTIDDFQRRQRGAFYTPKILVDITYRMIDQYLGENWKQEFVVWDPSCGTKNFTRDYFFKESYHSTIDQEELDLSSDLNPTGTSFQFDFLNDDFSKLPKQLLSSLQKKSPFILIGNPPYGKTRCDSLVGKDMLKNGAGKAGTDLYYQFLWRSVEIANHFGYVDDFYIIYMGKNYLASTTTIPLSQKIFRNFWFVKGFMVESSVFDGVAGGWSVCTSILQRRTRMKNILSEYSQNNTNKNVFKNCDYDDEILDEYYREAVMEFKVLGINKNRKNDLEKVGEYRDILLPSNF